ncbi:MAG: glycosyltransferase family 1 protein [Patescibacteria group bacterium]|nr:glycosyltransferase family 1 protein [Patescibacteria group bacterium]
MKILLDVRKIGKRQTGDEVYITNLIKNLMELDQQNFYYLATDSCESESLVDNVLGELPKNFKLVHFTPGGKLFWTNYALPHFAKKKKIDLVHVQYLAPLRLSSKIKLITTIHDISFKKQIAGISFKDRWIMNKFIPKSLKKADQIISVSNFTKQEIIKTYKKIPAKKIKVIYNGVNEKFKPAKHFDSKYLDQIRTKYELGKRYLLHLSSLQPRKNIPTLIEAYRDYIHKYKDENTALVIGGEKSYNYDQRIDNLLRDLVLKERVKMVGYIKDEELPAIYAMATAYVSPSTYEGFNLPLGEVMQSGVPVIASNIPCHKEILAGAGILINPKNIKNFSQGINEGLNNQAVRTDLIIKGHQRAKDFSWKKCAMETLKLYKSL